MGLGSERDGMSFDFSTDFAGKVCESSHTDTETPPLTLLLETNTPPCVTPYTVRQSTDPTCKHCHIVKHGN